MNDTKVISARIPMASYLELVRRAKHAKLSISDYIISTLFDDIETQLHREELIETLTNNTEVHRADAAKANLLLRHKTAKTAQLEEQNKSLNEAAKSMIKKHNRFIDQVISFVEKLDKSSFINSYKQTIENLPKAKWQESDFKQLSEN